MDTAEVDSSHTAKLMVAYFCAYNELDGEKDERAP